MVALFYLVNFCSVWANKMMEQWQSLVCEIEKSDIF